MKRAMLCGAGLLFLCGCAMNPANVESANDNIDYAKVQAINNAAWARGAIVHWRVYPTKDDKKS
ncbi:MAG: hypothetical protein ABI790_09000 [Betaproteobacteria bacterium]